MFDLVQRALQQKYFELGGKRAKKFKGWRWNNWQKGRKFFDDLFNDGNLRLIFLKVQWKVLRMLHLRFITSKRMFKLLILLETKKTTWMAQILRQQGQGSETKSRDIDHQQGIFGAFSHSKRFYSA